MVDIDDIKVIFHDNGNGGYACKRCPYVDNPFDGCHCLSMSSQSIEAIIYYCGLHYTECDTYRLHNIKASGNGCG